MVTALFSLTRLRLKVRWRLIRRKTAEYFRGSAVRLRRWRSLGARGERYAARYLERNHFYIWAKNIRSEGGEIDLIASQRRVLVFVEVKTRSADVLGRFSGIESVDEQKSKRLEQLAARYLKDHRALLKRRRIRTFRFDIIEVQKGASPLSFRVRQHLVGA